jgi:hypothetical protein
MTFALLTLLASLGVAAVTEWFSVVGIMTIYAGAAYNSALIMGLVLGGAKLVVISWLYRNWKYAGWTLRLPLIYFTVALMTASSIGVYGFLTKAHLEQGAATVDNSAKVERLDQQIAREKSVIADNEKVMGQLDTAINSYLGNDKTDRALSVRKAQAPQRKQLKDEIAIAQKAIDGFSDDRLKLTSEVRAMQLEVGPIKYIADLFYGDDVNATTKVESAVRIFTLLIVSTLDPLAVILLIAANHTLLRIQNEKKQKAEEKVADGYIGVSSPEVNEEVVEAVAQPGEVIVDTINIKEDAPDESRDASKGNVVVQFTSDSTKMDEEIPEEEIISYDIIANIKPSDWDFKDEIPEVPKEVFEPSKLEELLTAKLNLDEIVADSTLPEITINEEESIFVEEVVDEEFPVVDTEIVQGVVDNVPPEVEENSTSTEAVTVQEVQEVFLKKQPWANQPGVLNEFIGNSAHFIPQALDEKAKKAGLASGPERTENVTQGSEIGIADTQETTEEIEAVEESGQDSIQEENGTEHDSKEETTAASNDKYPKALSWLTEFKGI